MYFPGGTSLIAKLPFFSADRKVRIVRDHDPALHPAVHVACDVDYSRRFEVPLHLLAFLRQRLVENCSSPAESVRR